MWFHMWRSIRSRKNGIQPIPPSESATLRLVWRLAAECGQVAAFLSSEMASYVTGALIPVDGGTWASSGWLRTASGGWSVFGPDSSMG
jgi:NAD(P)-dependent dehydrogenase (short-subunit alcohol dehydrogenase family)